MLSPMGSQEMLPPDPVMVCILSHFVSTPLYSQATSGTIDVLKQSHADTWCLKDIIVVMESLALNNETIKIKLYDQV